MKKINRILIFALIFSINIYGNKCYSQEKKDSLKILFVGNSYTYVNNLPHIVSIISDSNRTKLVTKKSTAGGAKLSEHWFGKKGLKTKEIINSGQFDIVVLQAQSMEPINQPDSFNTYGHLLCEFIKENGAKPYLFLTWARKMDPQYQEDLNEAYLKLSKENDAVIIPVGPAWAIAQRMRPNIELFLPDESHPSTLGTFLTACVFTKTITGEIPNKLPSYLITKDIKGESIVLMRLMDLDLDIIFCQKIANQVIEDQPELIIKE
jgi:hypothetical protein